MKPDASIEVRFLTTAEGGRTKAVEGQFYACPIFIDNEGFDCRLFLGGKRLELGMDYVVPVKFLYPELVFPKLKVGAKVVLWEGRNVAIGRVAKVMNTNGS